MVNLDWNKILTVFPDDLTEQDKEDLYDDVLWYEIEPETSKEHVNALFRIAQEILKYKGEQVESLLNEIDNLAARQGEDEAQRHQSLLDEIEELQNQLSHKRNIGDISDTNIDEIQQDLVKLGLDNERLANELQNREKELLTEKRENEKLASKVMLLEQENNELRNELAALQRESAEQDIRYQTESPAASAEKQKELIDTVRQKNKHITQLLNDIEAVEKENNTLRLSLAGVRDELAEATEDIKRLTGEVTSLTHSLNEQQDKMKTLEDQNEGLRKQVVELVTDKNNRDKQLDHLGEALDARLAQWQELLVQKDSELTELKQRLVQLAAQNSSTQLDATRSQLFTITQTLDTREQQIEGLQKQLEQATDDINRSSLIIKQYKAKLKGKNSKNGESNLIKQLKQQLMQSESRIQVLEAKAKHAEDDAHAKAEEMTEMVIQLREYESGVYGLSEAVAQIKELKKQKKVRDRHIEQLVQAGNQLQSEANQLEEENLALRAQLGLDTDTVVRVDGIVAQHKAEKEKLAEVMHQLDSAEEIQLQLRMQNRKLSKQVKRFQEQLHRLGAEPEVVSSDEDEVSRKKEIDEAKKVMESTTAQMKAVLMKEVEEMENRLQDVIDENEALRKGMHEILDSVRRHDGSSVVHIESACLEHLLEALDSRHISGWYHPAMRLQAQLNVLEGSNAALREQLRIVRLSEAENISQLQKALYTVEELEKQITEMKPVPPELEVNNQEKTSDGQTDKQPLRIPTEALKFIEALKAKRSSVIKTQEKEPNDESVANQALTKELNTLKEELQEKKEFYDSDRESWLKVREGLQQELDKLNETEAMLTIQIKEYTTQWEKLKDDPDSLKSTLAENTIRLASLGSDNEKLKRKCSYLQETETKLKSKVDELREELFTQTNTSNQRVSELSREKMTLIAELKMIQQLHEDCVAINILEDVQQQLNQLSMKYRDLIQRQTILDDGKKRVISRLQNEIESLTKELDGIKSSVLEIAHASEEETDSSKDIAALKGQQQLDKQRIEHTERMYRLVKDQLNESEERCSKLEKELAAMVQQNLAAQLTESELRHQLVGSVPHSDFSQLKTMLARSDKQLAELRAGKCKLEETLVIAEKQVEEWKKIRHCHDYQHDALQRQVLELTAASEDKATIGRLTRELLRAQESELATTQQACGLQEKLKQSSALLQSYETQIQTLEDQLNTATQHYIQKNRLLLNIIHELHQRYLGSIPFVTADVLANLLLHAQQEKYTAIEYANKQLNIDHILEELQVKDVKSNERLQGLKLRVTVESLQSKLSQAEEQLKRQETLILALQQEIIIQDQLWEKKQLMWEQVQVESLRQSGETVATEEADTDVHDITNERQAQNYKKNLRDIAESSSVRTAKKLLHWKGIKPVRDSSPEEGQQLDVHKDELTPEEEMHSTSRKGEHITSNTAEDSKVNDNRNETAAAKNKELKGVVFDTNGIELNEKRIIVDSELSSNLKKQLSDVTAALNEQAKKLASYDVEVCKLKAEVKMLKDQLSEKEKELQLKEKELMDMKSSPEALPTSQQDEIEPETTEFLALKATVANLQNIVNQKEETIGRYQTLLKESRDEHSITVANLQQELQSLQETLEKKELLLTKLKNEDAPERGPAVKVILEKYLIRVHELEDEISQLKDQCAQLDGELTASQQQVEKWAHTAEERLKTIQEMKQKLESEKSQGNISEMSPTVVAEKQDEIARLNELVSQLKAKLESRSAVSVNKERVRSELERCKKRLEIAETRNTEDKAEIQRLRQQINARAHSTPKPEHVTSAREESLQKRVHMLEEQVAEMEKREEKERLLRKSRCMEEFDKWETRKRWQASTDKLKAQLQEKNFQVEALRGSYERCKDTVARLEKERILLETKLKTGKGTMVAQALVEELEKDRLRLQEELRAVRKSSELAAGSTSLTDVIEAQERRIAALQLAQKGECALAEEVERLQERKSQLQKCNLRLEAENLELKLQLERLRTSDTSSTPRDPIDTLSDSGEKAVPKQGVKTMKKRGDLERAVIVLKRVVEKLQAENKKLHSEKVDKVHDKGYIEKLQIELQKCQENYLDAVDKNNVLETELKEARTKIMVLEKEATGGELAVVKAQLSQKCSLLSKIKGLLESAVVREKALREQVAELQKLIPPAVLEKAYNISKPNDYAL